MSKINVSKLGGVSRTLLLPLCYRATESERADALLRDPKARELLERIDFDFKPFQRQSSEQVNALLRAREFDRMVCAFLAKQPLAVVVDLGCGLNTRFDRIDNGQVEWYDLDLPDVIALRRQLLAETQRCHMLASSALDTRWMDQLVGLAEGRPLFFVAEGLLPYLPEQQVKSLILALAERFRGAEIVFDAITPFFVRIHNLELAASRLEARLHWGLADDRDLEAWGEGLHLLEAWYYFDKPDPRQGMERLFRSIPPFARGARILRYSL